MAMDQNDPALRVLWSPMTTAGQSRFASLRDAIHRAYGTPATTQRAIQHDLERLPADSLAATAIRTHAALMPTTLQHALLHAAKTTTDAIFQTEFGTMSALANVENAFVRKELPAAYSAKNHAPVHTPTASARLHRYSTLSTVRTLGRRPRSPVTTSANKKAALASALAAASAVAVRVASMGHNSPAGRLPSSVNASHGNATPDKPTLKRPRAGDGSAEKNRPLRRARTMLADTTNTQYSTRFPSASGGAGSGPWHSSTVRARSSFGSNHSTSATTMTSVMSASTHPPLAGTSRLPRPDTSFLRSPKTSSSILKTRVFSLR